MVFGGRHTFPLVELLVLRRAQQVLLVSPAGGVVFDFTDDCRDVELRGSLLLSRDGALERCLPRGCVDVFAGSRDRAAVAGWRRALGLERALQEAVFFGRGDHGLLVAVGALEETRLGVVR